ncbi:MAG TPA: isoprenylcysteine carboxylmethyltransferase family protein [Kineosporiaceae bacterium]|nr:isoprenylcysteine carboxylmethyltransferase family protein [Kineosporiaceae bacterium]
MTTSNTRPDWGRLAMIPLGTLGALAATAAVARQTGPAHMAAGALTLAFYVLLLWAYLRRGRARSTSRAWSVWVASPLATALPVLLPLTGTGDPAPLALAAGEVLLVTGLAWSVWSIRTLGRSLSVVPQARELVHRGPYARVRHPLYLGEIIATLGLVLTAGGVLPMAGWVVLVLLQAYRASHEERLLGTDLPGYEAYRRSTPLLVPGLI